MLKCIDINTLVSKSNVREEKDETIRELADSIKINGLLSPITVRELSNGKYEILAGHRRYEALKRLNEPFVECNILEDIITNEDVIRVQLAENIQRKNMSPFEYVKIFEKLKSEYGVPNAKLAFFLNKSLSWVNDQYLAVDLLNRKYGDKIPEEMMKKSASTIKAAYYRGHKEEVIKHDGKGFTCTQKRHSYILFCTDFDFEAKLQKFLKENGMK